MTTRAVMVVSLGALSLAPGAASAQGWWDTHPMGWMWGAWGIGMMLMMVVFWGLLAVGLIAALRWLRTGSRSDARSDRALEILRERYARGEINREEFEARKRDLS